MSQISLAGLRKMKSRFLLVAIMIATSVFLTVPVLAATLEDLRKKFSLPTHVQLKPFQAPTKTGQMAPITVFMEAFSKDKIGLICQYQPRIMDALMTQLYRTPLKLSGRSLDLTGVADKMLLPINQALGDNLVKSVHIEAGARSMTTGSVSRLPFNASGCKGIKDLLKGQ